MSALKPDTVGSMMQAATVRFSTWSPSPRRDAELLCMHALDWNRARLFTHADTPLSRTQAMAVQALLERRMLGEPVAYITGSRGFWTLDLDVDTRVLIPRPETELVVERALALAANDKPVAAADLGTGSGAIALALASERPHWAITATDRSDDALRVARMNAVRLGLDLEWLQGSWFTPLPGRRFHLITANPPYVEANDAHLAQGDVRFEPAAALASGADGLDDLKAIISTAPEHLENGGWLILEHGYSQGHAVATLLRDQGFRSIRGHRDLGGQDRVTEGRLPLSD